MKKLILILIIFIFQNTFGQKVCLSDQNNNEVDFNEIITVDKCATDVKEKEKLNKDFVVIKKRRLVKSKRGKKRNFQLNKTSFDPVKIKEIKNNIENIALSISETKKIISVVDVDQIPLFISDKKEEDSFDNFNKKIANHIDNNLKYPTNAIIHKLQGIVKVSFIIDTAGEIKAIKAACDNSDILKEEAKRIISLLPKFIPGEHEGSKVNVFYSFHMEFLLK
ncbi:energy transducer TonB [Tenacibaculum salmonis]|uniref:energy transducer TonB n=1 Tax=Tenacibaculum sp. P3-BQ1 TaxID=3232310 RepID=UPI0034DDFE7D